MPRPGHSRFTVAGEMAKRLGGFLHRHAAIEAALDNPRLPIVERAETVERRIQIEQFHCARLHHRHRVLVERLERLSAAALLRPARDRVIDEHAAHGLRREREVVAAVLPLDPMQLFELQPGFVDERRRTQGMAGTLAAKLAGGNTAQLMYTSGRRSSMAATAWRS